MAIRILKTDRRIALVQFLPDPTIKFDYATAMGVRSGERQRKTEVDRLIKNEA